MKTNVRNGAIARTKDGVVFLSVVAVLVTCQLSGDAELLSRDTNANAILAPFVCSKAVKSSDPCLA